MASALASSSVVAAIAEVTTTTTTTTTPIDTGCLLETRRAAAPQPEAMTGGSGVARSHPREEASRNRRQVADKWWLRRRSPPVAGSGERHQLVGHQTPVWALGELPVWSRLPHQQHPTSLNQAPSTHHPHPHPQPPPTLPTPHQLTCRLELHPIEAAARKQQDNTHRIGEQPPLVSSRVMERESTSSSVDSAPCDRWRLTASSTGTSSGQPQAAEGDSSDTSESEAADEEGEQQEVESGKKCDPRHEMKVKQATNFNLSKQTANQEADKQFIYISSNSSSSSSRFIIIIIILFIITSSYGGLIKRAAAAASDSALASPTHYHWPLVVVPTASLVRSSSAGSVQQQHQQQQQTAVIHIGSKQSHRPGQLLIGQRYNNFSSSIIPYSPIQQLSDSEYGSAANAGAELGPPLLTGDASQPEEMLEPSEDLTGGDSSGLGYQAPDDRSSSKSLVSLARARGLLPLGLDSTRLMFPQMHQIKSRFNQGCVGGTKCQFFAFCWMSGGSLGASCGLLMTCCVTPSRQEIQPGFYGPVVNDPYCGRSTSKINRIVGGTDASFGQFPWQAFVQPSSIKVTLGDYILNSDIESIPHEVFSVNEVLLHPNFRFTPQADRYDVAVLELDRAATYKDNIKPICLPQKDATFVGRMAYVAGWGALQAGSKLRPKVLQHVAVPVIENQVCESWHRRKGIDIRIYDEMMCAGYELGQRDACQGDSGGPLMLNQFGVWYLVGIVSAGYSCAKQHQPGIYHSVPRSADWISSMVYQQGANR